MKKLVTLLFIFFITVVTNVSIATFSYQGTVKHKTITIILQEFDQLSGDNLIENYAEYFSDPSFKDKRVAILKTFFRRHDSPLYEHADFIVKTSDTYELDFRLIPAIAMQESTACKFIPVNSYNCWGWGIYGNKLTRFSSYQEGIETVAAGLKKNYIDHGLTTPEAIMAKYTPSSNGSWARGVSNVLGVLE